MKTETSFCFLSEIVEQSEQGSDEWTQVQVTSVLTPIKPKNQGGGAPAQC
jgi:hypothetical protein